MVAKVPITVCDCIHGYVCVCVQLDNQDSVRSLLKRTEAELNVRVTDALRKQEDPLQRQRLLVEEERLKYLNEEELIIQQLQSVEACSSNICSIIPSSQSFFKEKNL